MHQLVSLRVLGTIILFVTTMGSGCAQVSEPTERPSSGGYDRTVGLVANLFDQYHLQRTRPDDVLGAHAVEALLQRLDPQRLYLLEEDARQAGATASTWPAHFRRGDSGPALEVLQRYHQRVSERMAYALATLPRSGALPPADLNATESASNWAVSQAELNERWNQRLAARLAADLDAGLSRAQSNTVWGEAYQRMQQRAASPDHAESVATSLQAYASAYDSYSMFYPPWRISDFSRLPDASVGLVLDQVGDSFSVAEVMPGGPAALSQQILQGDVVLAVGESLEALQPTAGRTLEETVKLLRGPRDSRVYLQLARLRPQQAAEFRVVALDRDHISLAAQSVRAQVLHLRRQGRNHRVGLVRMPSFYIDLAALKRGDPEARSVVRDMEAALKYLQGQGVAGVVLDLRGNGGGALREAIDMTALFMQPAPVVLVERANQEQLEVLTPPEQGEVYQGPVAILLDRVSASGTELFAAALRDRGRAVLLGERSFGHGSVQTLVDIPTGAKAGAALSGRLKLTVARFYRVNGIGLDQTGLEPDLPLPLGPQAGVPRPPLVGLPLPVKNIEGVTVPVDARLAQWLPRLQARHQKRLPALASAASRPASKLDVAVRQAAEIVLDMEELAAAGGR